MESGFQAPDVRASLADAWQLVRQRFSLPETGLFYDYLSATGLDHLPTREEVLRQVPDRYGYGTGQEDCMISAGTLLDFLVSCAEASLLPEDRLRQDAAFLVQGIFRCALAHGVPGFLARAVCREDFSLVYPATSRDQYTMAVYGLWRLLRSSFSWGQTRDIARQILVAIATRMEETVRPENDFDSLQINGERDPRGLSRMWEVQPHEAARLPMIYAAAADATGDELFRSLCLRTASEAVALSAQPLHPDRTPTYARLQMQCSLALLRESVPSLRPGIDPIMNRLATAAAEPEARATALALSLDLSEPAPDWRVTGGLKPPYRTLWYSLREAGEAATLRLLAPGTPLPPDLPAHLDALFRHVDFASVTSCGVYNILNAIAKTFSDSLLR